MSYCEGWSERPCRLWTSVTLGSPVSNLCLAERVTRLLYRHDAPFTQPHRHHFIINSEVFFHPAVITCKAPDKPANGENSWNSSGTITPGHAIHYVCNRGFALNGPSAVVCQENGEFDHPPPTCGCKIARYVHSTRTAPFATAHADGTELRVTSLSGHVQGARRTGQWSTPQSWANHPVSMQQGLCPQWLQHQRLPGRRWIWSSAPYVWRWVLHIIHPTLPAHANGKRVSVSWLRSECLISQPWRAKHLAHWPTARPLGELRTPQPSDKQSTMFVTKDTPSAGRMPRCAKKMGNTITCLRHVTVRMILCWLPDPIDIPGCAGDAARLLWRQCWPIDENTQPLRWEGTSPPAGNAKAPRRFISVCPHLTCRVSKWNADECRLWHLFVFRWWSTFEACGWIVSIGSTIVRYLSSQWCGCIHEWHWNVRCSFWQMHCYIIVFTNCYPAVTLTRFNSSSLCLLVIVAFIGVGNVQFSLKTSNSRLPNFLGRDNRKLCVFLYCVALVGIVVARGYIYRRTR